MAPDPDRNDNPYREQTAHNTSTRWLDGHQPVDVDIDGMVDFAKSMTAIRGNLDGSTGHLDLLGSLPSQAWEGGVLGEAAHVSQKLRFHHAELQQYLLFLSQGLNNIGMAAQTIADAFQGTDGWSAATLQAVEFAFGDTSRGVPSGLPRGFPTKSWMDAYQENLANGNGALSGQLDQWRVQSTVYAGPTQIITYVNQDGLKRTVSVSSTGSGSTTVVTTYDANGNVVHTNRRTSSTERVGDTVVTTTTNYDGDGRATGSTVERTSYHGSQVASESTTTHAADGTVTGSTSTTNHSDGSQTITTTRGDDRRTVEIGPQTEGETSGSVDSPTGDALDDIEGHSYPTAPWVLGR